MNRLMSSLVALVFLGALSLPAFAQDQGQEPPPPPPDQQGQPGGFRGPGQGQLGRGGRGPAGRGQPLGAGRGGLAAAPAGPGPEVQKYDALRNYIEVVERFTELSKNPDASGVAAVVSATDLLRQRGPESAIAYLNKTLPEVKSPTVQRAIRIQLVDLYKASGQSEKALEQLDVLMKAQP